MKSSIVKLAEVAEINPKPNWQEINKYETASFVPMAAVSDIDYCLIDEQERAISEVRKGFTYFRKNDIILAKITPCFENGKVALANIKNEHGFGSTEFHVIRAKLNVVNEKYLYYLLRSPIFLNEGARNMTGSGGQKRVPKSFLENLKISLPLLAEQQYITRVLDQADRLRQQDRQLLAHYDVLLQTVFVELFGNHNPDVSKWPEKTIAELAKATKNSMRTGPFGSDLLHSEFVKEGTFVLGIDNVVNNCFEWAKPRFITEEKYGKLKRYTVYPGDVLISIMGTIGRTAVVPDDIPAAINSKHLAAITLNQQLALPVFISYSLYADPRIVRQLAARSKGAIMDGLNLGIIKDTKLSLPPLPLQQKFADIAARINQQKSVIQQQQAHSEALFQSLLQQAFRGELGGTLVD